MALLKAARAAQNVMEAEFSFTIGDTMVNTAGAADAFSSVAAHVFDVINLPPQAVVVGGEVVTDTAFTGSTAYNVTVGDSASAARYLGTTDKTTAGRTALVPTGYLGLGENLRLTVTPTLGAATAGKITVRVQYVVTGRANEVVPA
jgi:hypothetical protein